MEEMRTSMGTILRKSISTTHSNVSTSDYIHSNAKKNLFSLRLAQPCIRLSSLLEQMREMALIEGSTPVEIAALALQLLANEDDNRIIAKVATEIISSGGLVVSI